MGFKENLRDELSYRGILVKELAGMAGLNQRSVSNYLRENSSLPSAEAAVKIAKALGVTVEYLVTGEEPPINQQQPTVSTVKYTPEIRVLADKLALMTARDRKNVSALIDAMLKD